MLSPEDLVKYKDLVREADEKEIKAFVSDKVFKVVPLKDATNKMNCLWLRTWKGDIVKSRLVVRGFLDKQKKMVSRYSSTASRLSQRLLCSLAVENDFDLEQWDIGNAFLKGFSFDKNAGSVHKVRDQHCRRREVSLHHGARQCVVHPA